MKQKRIVIVGSGESGTGAALLAKMKGLEVFVSDYSTIKPVYKNVLIEHQIEFEDGKHSPDLILNADEIIKSPGIPETIDLLVKAREKKIPIISEIEFAARYTDAKLICITGSNGKTTTTELTYHILKRAGLNVGLAGNIGDSFAKQVALCDFDYYVIELSSFQLDGMYEFKADIAVLLNITPDHLDRYDHEFQNYIDSKFRVIQNMNTTDAFIYCADDGVIEKELIKLKIIPQKYPFSVLKKPDMTAYKENSKIIIDLKTNYFDMDNGLLSLEGDHNLYNSMAAGITGLLSGITNDQLRESLSDFKGVEHRLEKYIKVGGIQFINDSKATNVNSVWYALQTVSEPIILIMGGKDKGNDYGALKDPIRRKVKAIVAMGIDNTPIVDAFCNIVNVYDTNSMESAVKTAYQLAVEGDTVLLSPACASFDLFENYEDRGRKFKDAVRNL
jgi:UDP-N-acetylmuramoylalanine--D-glutamate ligase